MAVFGFLIMSFVLVCVSEKCIEQSKKIDSYENTCQTKTPPVVITPSK